MSFETDENRVRARAPLRVFARVPELTANRRRNFLSPPGRMPISARI